MGKPPNTVDTIWSKVQVGDAESCWPWTGGRTRRGDYGQVRYQGRNMLAHRLVWELVHGCRPPADRVIMHTCDHGLCCNPAHLRMGTQLDNIADMDAKGRRRIGRGERHHCARFTEADVRAIRSDQRFQHVIAEDYGVSQTAIHKIKAGKTWRHVR